MFMFQVLKYVPGGNALGIENEALAILGFGETGNQDIDNKNSDKAVKTCINSHACVSCLVRG
jgi:hypothetical protein